MSERTGEEKKERKRKEDRGREGGDRERETQSSRWQWRKNVCETRFIGSFSILWYPSASSSEETLCKNVHARSCVQDSMQTRVSRWKLSWRLSDTSGVRRTYVFRARCISIFSRPLAWRLKSSLVLSFRNSTTVKKNESHTERAQNFPPFPEYWDEDYKKKTEKIS